MAFLRSKEVYHVLRRLGGRTDRRYPYTAAPHFVFANFANAISSWRTKPGLSSPLIHSSMTAAIPAAVVVWIAVAGKSSCALTFLMYERCVSPPLRVPTAFT